MRREAFFFFFAALFFGVSAVPAFADNRVALVIGNGRLFQCAASAESFARC
jgi:hypothetical protein